MCLISTLQWMLPSALQCTLQFLGLNSNDLVVRVVFECYNKEQTFWNILCSLFNPFLTKNKKLFHISRFCRFIFVQMILLIWFSFKSVLKYNTFVQLFGRPIYLLVIVSNQKPTCLIIKSLK